MGEDQVEVTATTLPDLDREIAPRTVRGPLMIRHVEALGYDQHLVKEGDSWVDVDPETVHRS